MEPSPNSCFVKSGKRDNNALLHNVNKPARIINTRELENIVHIAIELE